ncbi:hypothetical protein BVG19_g3736 [[Candida] boidinii]|nr:hypothetical protein BVG19_g3736 [[Candida] boidinii]OWB50984.1 hypothetical protein B5S27_g2540 [[Candida] boidinii]
MLVSNTLRRNNCLKLSINFINNNNSHSIIKINRINNNNIIISPLNLRFISTKQEQAKETQETKQPKENDKIESISPSASDKILIKNDVVETKLVENNSNGTDEKKESLWTKIKHEANHYWNGTKLLGYEIKISSKLFIKMLSGYELTRRETSQLTRTTSDLLRLIPFSVLVVIPFAELLIPIIVKIFPNFLPSTYESEKDRKKKTVSLAKTRKLTSDFIQKTVTESGLNLPKKIDEEDKKHFIQFFKVVQEGIHKPTPEELIKVARCFKNDQVLDNLSRPQLMAMAKYMSLTPFGTDEMLRYQIRYKLLQIIKDDKAIDYEGVESLSIPELKSACALRGIKTVGTSPARLRDDLKIWLDLRLRQKIPSSLLILSSTFTYGDHADDLESYYDALLGVLSSIPDELYNMAKLDLITSDNNKSDPKLKLNILKEQQELIKEEEEQNKNSSKIVKDDLKLSDYEEEKETTTTPPLTNAAETESTKDTTKTTTTTSTTTTNNNNTENKQKDEK